MIVIHVFSSFIGMEHSSSDEFGTPLKRAYIIFFEEHSGDYSEFQQNWSNQFEEDPRNENRRHTGNHRAYWEPPSNLLRIVNEFFEPSEFEYYLSLAILTPDSLKNRTFTKDSSRELLFQIFMDLKDHYVMQFPPDQDYGYASWHWNYTYMDLDPKDKGYSMLGDQPYSLGLYSIAGEGGPASIIVKATKIRKLRFMVTYLAKKGKPSPHGRGYVSTIEEDLSRILGDHLPTDRYLSAAEEIWCPSESDDDRVRRNQERMDLDRLFFDFKKFKL
jgi:hypothetical protein